jgi:predicted PurR-regulated permease PerM
MEQSGGETVPWRFTVFLLIGGFFVYLLQIVLIPFAVAFILAFVFTPIIDRLERNLRLPRIIAILLVFLILAVPFAILAFYDGPVLVQNVGRLAENAPDQVTRFLAHLFGGEQVSVLGQTFDVRIVAPYLITRLQDLMGAPLGVAQVAWSLINVIMGAIFTFVVFFYFLAGGKDMLHGALRLAPAQHQEQLHNFIHRVDSLIGSYLRGLAVIVIFTASIVWLVFKFVFHLPYAPFLALTIGSLEVIPLFGPIVSGVLTGIVAVANGDLIFSAKIIAFYLVLRFTNDQVISPIVLGKAVTLSPVIVLFAFLAGSTLFGFLGLLFAVPVAAIFKILLDERTAG